jgi:L-ascorbate metabolism protein UlaG (beta-lactamase superfamily)
MDAQELVKRLHWLGHDSFRFDGPPVIYFDPWKLPRRVKGPAADLILVSHEHYDHCSPEDVARVRGPNTIVVANEGASQKLTGARVMRPGDKLETAAVKIEALPAYNVNKFRSPGVPFHPKGAAHLGYVVTVEGVRLYFAGDTDPIPEMAEIACDVAILPVSGVYVMTAEEAASAAKVLAPEIVVPMHYGSGIGSADDGRHFAELFEGQTVVLKAGD